LLYGIDAGGVFVLKKRTGTKGAYNIWTFNAWEDVNSGTGGGVSEIPVASATTRGGITFDTIHPFYITGADTLALDCDASLGTASVSGGNHCKLKVNTATDKTIGGIKTGYTSVDNTYPVQLNYQSQAYVTVPAATDVSYGVVKVAAAARTTAIYTTQGGTAPDRNYGVEVDMNGKAFVNVPWMNTVYKITATKSFTGTLAVNTAYIITGSNTVSSFAKPAAGETATYSIFVTNGRITFPSTPKIYWANGLTPPTTNGNYEYVINGYNINGTMTYTGTWASYS
jgi:hypothetical protein